MRTMDSIQVTGTSRRSPRASRHFVGVTPSKLPQDDGSAVRWGDRDGQTCHGPELRGPDASYGNPTETQPQSTRRTRTAPSATSRAIPPQVPGAPGDTSIATTTFHDFGGDLKIWQRLNFKVVDGEVVVDRGILKVTGCP